MTSSEIRQQFLDFFESKGHKIVPSSPLINKDDPTLMFTNSGMVQFKDYFLGNKKVQYSRIADTQKCLRVSGKHNDLEDVGYDGTHHTMFEMLGNWSFGDYFKEDAIAWSWELLTEVYKLPKDRLYATVFGGDEKENLEPDNEALEFWKKYLPDDHILYGNKKDNFWEMGDQGPCGPCSEIHFDMRDDADRKAVPGETLVNQDDPLVVEIWNNVFMQFNRKADSSLEPLPNKHVDTGMGFERLCMILQGVRASYDTDVFSPFIKFIEEKSKIKYKGSYERDAKSDIAMRVIVDHIRAVAFTMADGEMPGNGGASYVIRRILRRAVRYYYSFLNIKEPFMHSMISLLASEFKNVFPELYAQKDFVAKVILEEERSFLRTLEGGLKRMDQLDIQNKTIDGQTAFELYDTFGFPIDLTRLIASEKGLEIDEAGFDSALMAQKTRSRAAAEKQVGDWVDVYGDHKVQFVGYDQQKVDSAQVIKYRIVKEVKDTYYQIVLNRTPFYAEGGGQVGDKGTMVFNGEHIKVLDTKRENELIIHFVDKLPAEINDDKVNAAINVERRKLIENNHSATHLMHAALRQVLGTHVQQKGSLVNEHNLRFDFSHFQKVSDEEVAEIELIVNQKIRENISLEEARSIPIAEARESGAMMLFGEKYGETVRMITFDKDYSRELCGGCHVPATGSIGLFKIVTESAIAAGVRRIEAMTGAGAMDYLNSQVAELQEIKEIVKNPNQTVKRNRKIWRSTSI
jgi:alanyl-tRNA synthetase